MSGTNPFDRTTTPPHHEDFRWIHGPGQEEKFANFIELTRDVSEGIYARDLTNEMNQDKDPEQKLAPTLGESDSANLFRLSLAAATMLRDVSEQHIARLNKLWDE